MLMLTEFKTFIAVAQAGTFTAAGRSLGLTQSAVSAQIKRLEQFIGMPLFERSAKSAVLNAQGREVLAQAKEAVALVDRMRAPHLPGGVSGTVRIGAIAIGCAAHCPHAAHTVVIYRDARAGAHLPPPCGALACAECVLLGAAELVRGGAVGVGGRGRCTVACVSVCVVSPNYASL